MKLKLRIFALMAMLLCFAFQANAQVTTEADLRTAIATGSEVTLGGHIKVTEEIQVPAGVTTTLDLNGYAITSAFQSGSDSKHIYPFNNYGTFTIKDSKGDGSITGRGIYVQIGSTITINGGSIYGIDSNGGSALYQYGGDIVINGGRVEQKAEGTWNFAINSAAGTVTVKGGWVGGNHGAIAAVGGAVVIEDGEFVCTGTEGMSDNVLYSYGEGSITIYGGTFTADNDGPSGGCCVYDANGDITINGGTFGNSSGGDVWGTTGTTINGGTFENLIETKHVTVGSTIVNGGTTYTMTENGLEEIVAGLTGEGTAASPFLINNVDDLVWFQKKVDELAADGSTQFAGKYFKLTADINLADINWNPIGSMSGDHGSFKGVFDGDNHTISNLNVEQSGNGIGLFARTTGNAVIKNLKLNNVTVKSTDNSNYVGGVVGNAYASTKIENVHLSGNIYISGRGYIGGIAGHGYVVMDNVSVVATGDGQGNDKGLVTSTFWCAGGILGYGGEGATNIMNANVENVVVTSAAGGLGAIVGMAEDNNGTQPISGSNLSASNVEIKTYTGAYGDSYANYALGYLYGGNPTSKLTGEIKVENVGITTSNGVTPSVNDAVASIDGTIYFSLASAVAAADGKTITLLRDVELTETLTIPAGKTIALDLNGKTISQTKECTASYEMICNKGNLTIKGEGKISFKDTSAGDPDFGWGSYTLRNEGTLVVENSTIEHLGEQNSAGSVKHMYCAIFQYCGSTTINGGTISTPTYRSVRLWKGDMTINGGTFNGQVWVQAVDNSSNLEINGGTFSPAGVDGSSVFVDNSDYTVEFAVTGGTFNTKIGCSDAASLAGAISGGSFTAAAKENTNSALIADGCTFGEPDENGLYGIVSAPVAKVGEDYYTDLQEALNAAAAGTGNVTVTILENVDLTGVTWDPVTVSGPGYPEVTVEGNDKTITGLTDMLFAGTWAGGSGLIIKNLTIENSAIVNDKEDSEGTVGVGAFIGYPQASATITLENCHLKNSSVEGGHWTGGLIGMAGGYNGTDGPVFMNLTIKGCSVTGSTITGKGSAGGVIGHGSCAAWTNVVIEETTVSGNTITSTGSSTNKAGAVMGTIGAAGQATTVNGVTNTGGASVSATVAGNTVTSNGTEITTIYGRQGTETGMLYVAGGSYDNYPIEQGVSYAAPKEGYEIVENADGTFGIQEAEVVVAKIGEVEYETLAAALTAAKDDETVTLLWAEGDPAIAMNAAVFGKNVTITGTATVDWSKGWFYVGRGGAGNATVTFDGANLTSASTNENSGLGIHVSGREKDTNNKYDGTLVIKNSTIALDYLINRGAIELGEGAVLTVKNGFGIAGRPASETENGEAATATVTLNNGSKLVVNNHNGMGLGQAAVNLEGYGIMNVNEGATFETTQNFLVTANGTMNVAAGGAVNVNGTLTVNGTLVSAGNIAATIAAGDAANIEISGGVYTQNVAEWCIDGYAALLDLNGNYVVGEAPTATVNNLGATTIPGGEYSIYDGSFKGTTATDPAMPLSFVMQFLADQDEDDMATSPYADWYGDFVLTFTGLENDSFSAEGCYLAGYYGSFGWVKVPVEGLLSTIEEGVRYPVMLGVGLGQKYDYICTGVKDFRCALYIPETVLEANPNIEVKLELSVVDNSKGQDAAAEALVNNTNIYEVGAYEYEAKDFNPGYLREFTINDADALDYTQAEDKIIGTLTYNRTLMEGIWNPLYLPFSVSLKNLADNYEVAYYNTMHSYDNDNNGTFETFEMEVLKLTANELNDVMLKANYPYFIRPKNADACALQIVETDATLFAAAEKVITTTSVSHTFQLKSTHKALDAAALTGCYAISVDGDWALTEGLKPHRLYLTISANDDSPYATTAAKTIRIVARGDEGFEGTTGVDIVETDNAADGTIYDLSGRPVEEPVKGGMYIINGKKVVY